MRQEHGAATAWRMHTPRWTMPDRGPSPGRDGALMTEDSANFATNRGAKRAPFTTTAVVGNDSALAMPYHLDHPGRTGHFTAGSVPALCYGSRREQNRFWFSGYSFASPAGTTGFVDGWLWGAIVVILRGS